jgi:predicted nucleic acid-binding protein
VRDLFVDSSAFYALADRTDKAHPEARTFLQDYEERYFTTSLVFVESMSLLTKRLGKAAAVKAGNWILGSEHVHILHVDAQMQREAWRLFEGHLDKDWDMVDCSSFAFMKRHGITTAFGFDRHFTQAGFRLVPER